VSANPLAAEDYFSAARLIYDEILRVTEYWTKRFVGAVFCLHPDAFLAGQPR
jgi:hypothetical protein